jgi:hypothetical protein
VPKCDHLFKECPTRMNPYAVEEGRPYWLRERSEERVEVALLCAACARAYEEAEADATVTDPFDSRWVKTLYEFRAMTAEEALVHDVHES